MVSDVICLGVLSELMTYICDPNVVNGEAGYYLTVLGAALAFLRNITEQQVAEWERTRCTAGGSPTAEAPSPSGGGGGGGFSVAGGGECIAAHAANMEYPPT